MAKLHIKEQRDVELVKAKLLGHTTCHGCKFKYVITHCPVSPWGNLYGEVCCAKRQDASCRRDERCRYYVGDPTIELHAFPAIQRSEATGRLDYWSLPGVPETARRLVMGDARRRYPPPPTPLE